MTRYKMIKYLYIDNITGQEKNAADDILERLSSLFNALVLEQPLYTSNDIVDLVHAGYECCTVSNVLIRLSKEICVGASRITRYILFKEV